jgi:hypothetical protein
MSALSSLIVYTATALKGWCDLVLQCLHTVVYTLLRLDTNGLLAQHCCQHFASCIGALKCQSYIHLCLSLISMQNHLCHADVIKCAREHKSILVMSVQAFVNYCKQPLCAGVTVLQ